MPEPHTRSHRSERLWPIRKASRLTKRATRLLAAMRIAVLNLAIAMTAVPAVWAQPAPDNESRQDVVSSWSGDVFREADQGVLNAERAIKIIEQLRAAKMRVPSVPLVSSWPEAYTAALYAQAQQRGLFQANIERLASALSLPPRVATLPMNRATFSLGSHSHGMASMIREVLRREGLPSALVAVPLVESGFDPLALSPQGARGIWQLMPATARRFGLRPDGLIDERTDPVRSTLAAVRYLKELHERWGDWALALAAYNAGEGRIERALSISGAHDFPTLVRLGMLPEETRLYVPAVLAAAEQMKPSGVLVRAIPSQFATGVLR